MQMAADDRAKGEGWQMQKRKGWMSGQLRPEKLVAEAITTRRKAYILSTVSSEMFLLKRRQLFLSAPRDQKRKSSREKNQEPKSESKTNGKMS